MINIPSVQRVTETTIYKVMRHSEDNGPSQEIAYFANVGDAESVAATFPFRLGETRPIRVYHSLAEYEAEKNSKLRAAALAKLSSDERKALGL